MERIWDLATPLILRNNNISLLPSPIVCRTDCWVTYSSRSLKVQYLCWNYSQWWQQGDRRTGQLYNEVSMRACKLAGNAKGASYSLSSCLAEYPAIPQYRTTDIFCLEITPGPLLGGRCYMSWGSAKIWICIFSLAKWGEIYFFGPGSVGKQL